MKNIWFISDTHLSHANILQFRDNAGELIRPGFSSIEEMNARIIDNWNTLVKPGDKVYHLGDFAFGPKSELGNLVKRLHGRKRLIVGNHDPIKELAPFFEKVCLWRVFKEHGFTCTHLPMRLEQQRKTSHNVHGHIHQNLMTEPGYINVCVEHTDFKPVHLDDIVARIRRA